MIHWTWILFVAICCVLIGGFVWVFTRDDEWLGCLGFFITAFLTIAFILLWGGIFWW